MEKHNIDVRDALKSLCELKCFIHSDKNKQSNKNGNLFDFQKDIIQGIEGNLNSINNYLDLSIKEEESYSQDRFQSFLNGMLAENVKETIPLFFNYEELQPLKTSFEYKRFQNLSEKITKEKELSVIDNTHFTIPAHTYDIHIDGLQNLVDIKKDENYELLYIKDNLEKNFFSDHLINLIKKQEKKLVNTSLNDPFIQINIWGDVQKQMFAKMLLQSSIKEIVSFCKISLENLDKNIVNFTHKSLMALLLAKNSQNLLGNLSVKSCTRYLQDFIYFFRLALIEKSNLKENEDNYLEVTINLLNDLSEKLFFQKCFYSEIKSFLEDKIESFREIDKSYQSKKLSYLFLDLYEKLDIFFKNFPNGPLFKAIDIVISQDKSVFDTFYLGFLPDNEGTLHMTKDRSIQISRIAAPIIQASLEKMRISDEFISFLEFSSTKNMEILFVHLENRRNLKSRNRTKLFEELSERVEFSKNFHSIIIPDSLDFLNYFELQCSTNTIDEFIQLLYLEVTSNNSFYFFSQLIEKDILGVILNVFEQIKNVFFDTKKSFFKNDKLFFLDIFSSILILKSLEIMPVSLLLLSSKDGLDEALSSLCFLKLLIRAFSEKEKIQENFVKEFLINLLSPTLIMRDRLLFSRKIEMIGRLLGFVDKKAKNIVQGLSSIFFTNIEEWIWKEVNF